MAETEENIQLEKLNDIQEKALDIFFKAFSRAVTSSQMYFSEHPSFDLALKDLKDKLGELKAYWQELSVGIAFDKILVNGIEYKSDSPRYQDLAKQFHRYKIQEMQFDVAADLNDLKEFILLVSRCEEYSRQGKDIFEGFSQLKTVRVRELDYSYMLSNNGDFSQAVWDTLLGEEDKELLQQNADYLVENVEQLTSELNSLGQNEKLAKKVLDRYGDIDYALEKADATQKRIFSRSIVKFTLSQNAEVQNHYLSDERFSGMRKIVKESLDKNQLFAGIVNQIGETGKVNPLLTQFYNSTLDSSLSSEELATDLSEFLNNNASSDEMDKVVNVVKELFLEDNSDKFVSSFYNTMLSNISEKEVAEEEAIKEKYRAAFLQESIIDDYWYTLLDVLHYTDKQETVEKVLEILCEYSKKYIEEGLYDALCDFVIAMEHKRENLQFREYLDTISSRINLEGLIKEILMPNFKELTNKAALAKVVTCLAQPEEALLERFFHERDSASRSQVVEILMSLPVEKVIGALESFVTKNLQNQLIIKEAMLLFDGLWIEPAARVLVDLFNSYKGNVYMQCEIGKVLIQNPYCPKELFEPYIQEKHAGLRRLAVTISLQRAESEEKKELMKKLFEVENWFGSADEFLISNIETVALLRTNEAMPYLEKIALSPAMFFKEKRDKLRIAALEAIQDIDITVLFRHKDSLLKDSNPQVKKIISDM